MIFKYGDKVEVVNGPDYVDADELPVGEVFTVHHMLNGYVYLEDAPSAGGWFPGRFKRIPPQTKDVPDIVPLLKIKKNDKIMGDPIQNASGEMVVKVHRPQLAYPPASTGTATINPGKDNSQRVSGVINYKNGFMWSTESASGIASEGAWDNFIPDWSLPGVVRELPKELREIFGSTDSAQREVINYVDSRLSEIIRNREG